MWARCLNRTTVTCRGISPTIGGPRVPLSRNALFQTRESKVTAKDLSPGTIIKWNGKYVEVVKSHFNKTAMRRAMVIAELKDFQSGRKLEHTFRSEQELEEAEIENEHFEFVQLDGTEVVLKNQSTEEEERVPTSLFVSVHYLPAGTHIKMAKIDDRFMWGSFADVVTVTVEQTDDSFKSSSEKMRLKEAVTNSGATISVPPHIKKGERVVINSIDGTYIRRATADDE